MSGAVRSWLVWWTLCAALWLALVDRVPTPELVAGAVVAALAATGAIVVRRRQARTPRLPRDVAVRAARAARGQVTDLPLLVRVLWRRGVRGRDERGVVVERPFAATRRDDPRHEGERVAAEVLGTLAPAKVVIDVDVARGVIVEHLLEER